MQPVALLGFSAPAMLAGLFLIGLPLIAHWMNRRVRSRLVFPSLKLLRDASTQREQFGAWRRWLLFLLRAAAVALIAAAFALPFWSRSPAAAGSIDGPGATLVLIDTSASMGRALNGGTLFQHATAAAADVVNAAARRGDHVLVIAVGHRPDPLLPSFSANAPALVNGLATLNAEPVRADWPAALAYAARLFSETPGNRQLFITSDFQTSNWQELLDGDLPVAFHDTEVTLIAPPLPAGHNIGLHNPSLHPPYAAPGQPTRLSVHVANYDDQPQSPEIELHLGDLQVDRHTLDPMSPGETREITFQHTFEEPGLFFASFTSGPDNLSADNRAYLACTVLDRPPVAIVSDRDPDRPGSAVYYLQRALSPRNSPEDPFEAFTLPPLDVSEHTLRGLRAVWVVDAPALDETAADALRAYAERGGLAILASSPEAIVALRRLDEPPGRNWLPLALEHPETAGTTSAFLLREERDAADLLTNFDFAARDALARIALRRRLAPGRIHPEARLALRFDDGVPALAWRDTSGGRIIMAAFDPAREAGTLGASAIWVALGHALMEAMPAEGRPAGSLLAGENLRLSATGAVAGGPEPVLRDPSGVRLAEVSFLLEHTTLTASLPVADQTGFYTLHQGETLLGAEAVNLDPRESDPRRIPTHSLLERLQSGPATSAQSTSTSTAAARIRPHRAPLWGWALAATVLLLGLESLLLTRWRS